MPVIARLEARLDEEDFEKEGRPMAARCRLHISISRAPVGGRKATFEPRCSKLCMCKDTPI